MSEDVPPYGKGSVHRDRPRIGLTLPPYIKEAAAKYCEEHPTNISRLTEDLLEEFLIKEGFLKPGKPGKPPVVVTPSPAVKPE